MLDLSRSAPGTGHGLVGIDCLLVSGLGLVSGH